jgi:hypothetical protein
MDYGNIIYFLAIFTLASVLGVLAFSFFKTRRRLQKSDNRTHEPATERVRSDR